MINKKILIGSIIAVAILIGISFTSVVGYQSVKSDVKASPLFNIRTNRAIDEESKDLIYDYVGKGEETNLYLPRVNDVSEEIETFISDIKNMDDRSLRRVAYLITNQLHQKNELQQYTIEDTFQSLKQLKDNPDIVNQYMTEDSKILTNACTISPTCGGSPLECFVFMVKLIVFSIIYVIIFHIYLRINYLITIIFKCNDNNI